jgi:hypothetical protein
MDTKHNSHPSGGYERTDADIKYLAGFAVGLVVLMFAGMFAMRLMYVEMGEYRETRDPMLSLLAAELPKDPPEPRLQVLPAADLQRALAADQEKLTGYGWVEPNAGVVRIPVERAMELVLERGLPTRAEASKQEARK